MCQEVKKVEITHEESAAEAKPEKESIYEIAAQIAGIHRIDTRALARMISWAIGNCDHQMMILKSAMNVLKDEAKKSRKKNE